MSKEACPTVLQEQHEGDIQKLFELSWPVWVRDMMLAAIGFLFVWVGGLWFYMSCTYAQKDEMKEMRTEIRADMKEIKDKLDTIKAKP